jgi:hypothetical protein
VDDVLLAGEALEALLRYHLAVDRNLEDAAASGDQRGLDAEGLLELGRRTGGPRKVASDAAVGDGDH